MDSETECMSDYDGDGYGDIGWGGSDCDDWWADSEIATMVYEDADGDSFGGDSSILWCFDWGEPEFETGMWSYEGSDCYDTNLDYNNDGLPDGMFVYHGAAFMDSETECMSDYDGDGYGSEEYGGTDCDDNSFMAYPGAAFMVQRQNYMEDNDGDGYGSQVSGGTDCDDADSYLYC